MLAPAATWFCPPTTNRRCPEDTQATRLRNVVSVRISDTRYPPIRAGFIVHPEDGAAGAYLADLAGWPDALIADMATLMASWAGL